MQDAGKQRPYYGRGLVVFAHGTRPSDVGMPGLGWIKVHELPSHVQHLDHQVALT